MKVLHFRFFRFASIYKFEYIKDGGQSRHCCSSTSFHQFAIFYLFLTFHRIPDAQQKDRETI